MSPGPRDQLQISRGRFAPPTLAPGIEVRELAMQRLNAPGLLVALVVAPGGYGKTSHVAAWANADTRAVAWMDVDESGADPHVLLASLVEALSSITDLDAHGLSGGGASPAQFTTMVAPCLGQALRRCETPFVLVLDDVHVLTNSNSADLLDVLVNNVPRGSTVVLIGRTTPVPSMRRLRTQPGVAEITSDHLALDPDEVERVLAWMGIASGEIDAAQVVDDTEGWPVGVRLFGAYWHAHPAGHHRRPRISGRDPHVSEYLSGEWLAGLSAEQRDFMLAVSSVDWLSGPLCNAISGRNDAGEMLYRIFSDGSMLIPLDRRAEAYRMHPLLREALRAEFERLDAAGARAASARASEWFEATGDIDRAVGQAQNAGDFDRAERLVVAHAPAFYTNGHYSIIKRWLDAMPRDRVLASASLCLCAAMASLGRGDRDAMVAWLNVSEQIDAATSGDESPARLHLLVWQAVVSAGPHARVLQGVSRAYADLPPGIWHSGACFAYGAIALATDDERAESLLAEGAEEARIWGAPAVEGGCKALLGIVAQSRGETHRASVFARDARRIATDNGLEQAPLIALVLALDALIGAVEGDQKRVRAEVDLSRRHLAFIHQLSGWAQVETRLALTRASLLIGDRVGAGVLLREIRECLVTQPDAVAYLRQCADLEKQVAAARTGAVSGPSSLTTAELRVLHYMPTNLTLSDIGSRLYLSRFTIKSHCSAIYRKLAVNSRAEAVDTARSVGLLP